MIGEVRLDGKQYSLWLAAERTRDGNYDRGGNGEESTVKWQYYGGSAKITNKETGEVVLFNFQTLPTDCYFPKVDSVSFEDSILVSRAFRILPLVLSDTINPQAVVDLFAKNVMAWLQENAGKSKLPIPRIVLPTLDATVLGQEGLVAEPDGQVALAVT